MATIIVIGGGFGGVYALFRLERLLGPEHKLLLIEPRDRFVFTPLLHEVAGGVLHKESVTVPYGELLRRVHHIHARAERIDLERKTVTADGRSYAFDYLILAHGSKTNLFGKHFPVLELKTFSDAVSIRATIEQNVLKAAQLLAHDPRADVSALLHVVIVGAGPTGVELAGEAADLLRFRMKQQGIPDEEPRVTIINARARLLPQLDPYFHTIAARRFKAKGVAVRYDAKVIDVHEGRITLQARHGTEELLAGCVIWTAGIVPNAIAPVQRHDAPVNITATLQLADYAYVYAVGDATRIEGMPLPALAQVASRQGELAAENIARMMRAQPPRRFTFKERGMLISIGQKYAVGRVYGVPIKGFPAWFLMRTIYLFKFKSLKQDLRTAWEYTVRLFRREKACAAHHAAKQVRYERELQHK